MEYLGRAESWSRPSSSSSSGGSSVPAKRDGAEDDLDLALDQTYQSQQARPVGSHAGSTDSPVIDSQREINEQQAARKAKFKRIGQQPTEKPAQASAKPLTDNAHQKVKYVMGPDGKLKKKVKKRKQPPSSSEASQAVTQPSTPEVHRNQNTLPPSSPPPTDTPTESTPPPIATPSPSSLHVKSILRHGSASSTPSKPKPPASVKFADPELTEKELAHNAELEERLAREARLAQELEAQREATKREIMEETTVQHALFTTGESKANRDDGSDGSDIFSDEGSDYNPFEDTSAAKQTPTAKETTAQPKNDYFANIVGSSTSSHPKQDDNPDEDEKDLLIQNALKAAAQSRARSGTHSDSGDSDDGRDGMKLKPLSRPDSHDLGDGLGMRMYADDDDDDDDDAGPAKKRKRR